MSTSVPMYIPTYVPTSTVCNMQPTYIRTDFVWPGELVICVSLLLGLRLSLDCMDEFCRGKRA
jgi:hypothetical protein